MVTIQHEGSLTVAGIFARLEIADFQRLETEIESQLGRLGKVNLLLDLRGMLGYTLDVALEDLRFSREHAREVGRVAILSEDTSMVWTALLSDLFVRAHIRVFDDEARFRVNIFSQRGNYSCVLRRLNTKIPTLADLQLPEIFLQMAKEKTGLVLVTGATGSGKSTTLAALLNEVNESKSIHVVTLEDPVEFVHPQKKATFNQRELGTDFDRFSSGLRAALRQAPKIILVGEMRDRETVELGLSAAETGRNPCPVRAG